MNSLTEGPDGELLLHSTLFNRIIGVMFDKDESLEYADLCAGHLNSLPPELINQICNSAIRYCNEIENITGAEISTFSNLSEVLKRVTDGCLIVHEPPVTGEPIVHIEANCDWEVEHGIEILIRGNRILYLGGFNSEDPYDDYTEKEPWNYA